MTETPEPVTDNARRTDAIRRLQVGGTGLTLVALLVGLSTLLTSETRQAGPAAAAVAGAGADAAGADAPANAGDPLTDLGVEPASAESSPPPPTQPQVAPQQPVGPIVPDLQPDPQLKGTAPR